MRARHFTTLPNSHRFNFGVTERVPLAALKPYLNSFIDPTRQYVLVGHSLGFDIEKLIPVLGFDLRFLPNVVGQLDTFEIVRDMPVPQRLSELWKHLSGIDPVHAPETEFFFHNAGNDAVYTLQVLLTLVMSPESEWVALGPRSLPLFRQLPMLPNRIGA